MASRLLELPRDARDAALVETIERNRLRRGDLDPNGLPDAK
jgi:hypothetical protein